MKKADEPMPLKKRFHVKIDLFIDCAHIDEMWEIFRASGLHDILNQTDATDCYDAEVIDCSAECDQSHREGTRLPNLG
jgi:hypothetical protein